MKSCNRLLCCVAAVLFMTCFIFSFFIAKSALSSQTKATRSNKTKISKPIDAQQKEIKDGLRRIEKKLERRRGRNN